MIRPFSCSGKSTHTSFLLCVLVLVFCSANALAQDDSDDEYDESENPDLMYSGTYNIPANGFFGFGAFGLGTPGKLEGGAGSADYSPGLYYTVAAGYKFFDYAALYLSFTTLQGGVKSPASANPSGTDESSIYGRAGLGFSLRVFPLSQTKSGFHLDIGYIAAALVGVSHLSYGTSAPAADPEVKLSSRTLEGSGYKFGAGYSHPFNKRASFIVDLVYESVRYDKGTVKNSSFSLAKELTQTAVAAVVGVSVVISIEDMTSFTSNVPDEEVDELME